MMSESGTYVYVSQHGSEQISVLRLASDSGELTRIQDLGVGGKVMPMAVSPDRRFLYAALRNNPNWSIESFAIEARSGKLTHLSSTPSFNSTVYLSTDKTGKFLFCANNPNNYDHRTGALSVSAIGDQGVVQSPYDMIRTAPKLHATLPDPSNRFVFGTSCDGDSILGYKFDAVTGAIDPAPLPPVLIERKRGPRHFVFHPNNRFLYLVNEYDASVYVFRYDIAKGNLHELQVADAKPEGYTPIERGRLGISAAGADLHFTPDGRWLYVSVRGSLTMAVFAVDPTSGLMRLTDHFPMPKEPRGFNVDPFGRYLLVAGDADNTLVSFRIDSGTGGLQRVAEYSMGEGPNWVECVRLN
ncbi:lactonase family protein [Aminobacter sp. AP02]|uniref:lactonase family protein n=1 Tax=Aminobacter sp. AP02 TaxID=2135737 RepID=UPI000D6D523F|nr:lactonase family protein [Aminobacter sp. AP02]PWK61301.1 6-phosphogluconolactonase [Aminobacter sp. AP02]